MNQEGKEDEGLRRYLLGELNEAEQQALEERLLTEKELFDLLPVIEDELVDDYLGGVLSSEEATRFESRFLLTPDRRRKLSFAMALRRYASTEAVAQDYATEGDMVENWAPEPMRPSGFVREAIWWNRALASPYVRMAAVAVIVFGVGLGIWRTVFYRSPLDKGLAALAAAYRDERPTQSRISGLDYATYPNTRGVQEGKYDRISRQLAEVTLLDELAAHPNADAHHAVGRLYLVKRDYDGAINQFEEALKGQPGNAQLYSDYGAALLEKGRFDNDPAKRFEYSSRALEQFNRALELNDSLQEALFNRALCYSEMGMRDKATEGWRDYLGRDPDSEWAIEARRRLREAEQNKLTSETADGLFQQFAEAFQTRDDEGAWKALRQSRSRASNMITDRLLDSALEMVSSGRNVDAQVYFSMASYAGQLDVRNASDEYTGDLVRFYETDGKSKLGPLTVARRLMRLARSRQDLNEYDSAADLYSKAKEIFNKADDVCEADLAEHLAGTSRLRIEPQESLRLLERLSVRFKRRRYTYLLAQSLIGIADAQSSYRNVSASLEASRQASDLSRQIEDINGILRSWQTPLAMLIRVGNYGRSLEWIARAFELGSRATPDPLEMWAFYHQAGMSLCSLGLPRAALDCEQEALRLADESGRALYKSRSYARLGMIYERLGNRDEAVRQAHLALAEAESVEGAKIRANIVANAALHLADLYRDQGDSRQAVTLYDRAIQIHARLNIEGYILDAHRGKLLALMKLNDSAAIEAELAVAVPLIEQYRSKISEESNRNSFFELAQGVYDIAIDHAHSHLKNDRQAFDYAEASRARSLLDLMTSSGAVSSRDEKPELTVQPAASPAKIDDIQRGLPADVEVLQYSLLDDKYLISLVSRGTLETREGGVSTPALERMVRSFVDQLRNPSDPYDRMGDELGRNLYEALIGPFEGLLDAYYVCIVPDGILNYLPFGALISPRSGRYFVEEHNFGLSPSTSIFLACTRSASGKEALREERFLGVGNPDFDRGKFPDLPSAAREVSDIARLYKSRVLLIGSDADDETVKRAMRRAEIVHLASHYVTDSENPLSSRLLLAAKIGPDGLREGSLKASEIYEMKLPRTRLVVLSACDTLIERSYRGEGAIGIARPFIKAGVPLVIASLWPVESDSTAELMIRFQSLRKQNLPTTEALCSAQREMAGSGDRRRQHPYYWAAFAAIGGYATF